MRRSNYETCVICGQRKALDYFTRGGLCDRKCEDCVGKDYVPEFARAYKDEAKQMAAITVEFARRTWPGLVLAVIVAAAFWAPWLAEAR